MCGIAGVYTPGIEISSAHVLPMLKALKHRGPDGEGQFIEKDAALLHARLSIVDLEHGQQPLYSQDQQQVLIANGEIYNHIELRQDLRQKGQVFTTGSDCEVILPLFRENPSSFLSKLKGMFAIALFDRQTRQLSLHRDRFGIKPLYYMEVKGGIAFASEIKALLALLDKAPEINPIAVSKFLQINFSSGESAAFSNIKRLAPGQSLYLNSDGKIRTEFWWSLTDELSRKSTFSGSVEEALEEFDQRLEVSLTEHLRSDVPVGLFLSGGVDSSILATQLSRLPAQSGQPKAWSLGFQSDSVQDESSTAAEVAKVCGIDLEVIRVDPIRLFDNLVYTLWATDELMGDFASLPTLLLAQAASGSHKVVLTGEGGDEVFAGYGRYRMPTLQRWLQALKTPGTGGFRTRGRFDKSIPRGWLLPERRQQMSSHWREPFKESWRASSEFNRLQRQQINDIDTWLVDDLLTKADRMLMACGVEGRVPFLDHELVLFGLGLPDEMKIEGRLGKQLPRKWLQQNLKGMNSMGKKKGFSVPVVDWVQSLDRKKLLLAFQRSATLNQFVDLQVIEPVMMSSSPLHKSLIEPLAALIQLAIWAKLFVENSGQIPPKQVDPIEWLLS